MPVKRGMVIGTVAGTIFLVALTIALIAWVGADAALKPDLPRDSPSLDAFPFPVEEIQFRARDGTPLAGWFIAAAPPLGEEPSTRPKPTVVLVPGYGGTRDLMLPHADMLSAAGFSVFVYDGRGVGHSSETQVTFGLIEPLDVLGAVDFLSRRRDVDPQRIAVMGIAMGGSVALVAAAEDNRIRAVVAEAPYASFEEHLEDALAKHVGLPGFGLRPLAKQIVRWRIGRPIPDRVPLEAAERLAARPVLLVQDSADPGAGIGAIFDALPGPKTLWVAHGARRGAALQEFPVEYVRRVVDFLRGVIEPAPIN